MRRAMGARWIGSGAGGLSAALGAAVIIGWSTTHAAALVDGYTCLASMRFKAAIGFLLGGLGLLFLSRRKWQGGQLCGVAVAMLGLLSLVQQMTGMSLGNDGSLHLEQGGPLASHSGGMAFNTALSFTLLGAAFTAAGGRQRLAPPLLGVLGTVVAGLGMLALGQHLSGVPSAHGWGQLMYMAVPTAIGFLVLSLGAVSTAWALDATRSQHARWVPLALGIAVAAVSVCIWQAVATARLPWGAELELAFGLVLALALTLAAHASMHARARARTLCSARDRLDAEVQARTAELEKAVHARDAFLSAASHELKTPLHTLSLACELLDRRLSEAHTREVYGVQDARSKVHVIVRQARLLESLVEQMLDASAIAEKRLVLDRAPMELVACVQGVLTVLEEQVLRAACTVEVQAPGPVEGTWDQARIEAVITNLVANAIKYGPGKPIAISIEDAGDMARVHVRDHGIGIPAQDLERIFQRFERVVSVRHYGGLGLGLWIARALVEAHGGSISVTSTPGAGASFVVSLPKTGAPRHVNADDSGH